MATKGKCSFVDIASRDGSGCHDDELFLSSNYSTTDDNDSNYDDLFNLDVSINLISIFN